MKKYVCLFISIYISLAFLSGCSNDVKSSLNAEIDNVAPRTTLNQSADITELKPTTIETVNNFDGVTMAVKKRTISSIGLTVTFENNSNVQCIYGEDFSLEKKIDGEWYQVPVAIDNYAFTTIGYDLPSRGYSKLEVNWDWLYGSLNAGEYRIVKGILNFRGTGDYDTHILAAEFTIN